jgi:ribosomal protein L21E
VNKDEIREKLEKSKERMQRTGDKRRFKLDKYKKGDKVYVHEEGLKQKGKINKLDQLYRGPVRIVAKNENYTYKLA